MQWAKAEAIALRSGGLASERVTQRHFVGLDHLILALPTRIARALTIREPHGGDVLSQGPSRKMARVYSSARRAEVRHHMPRE